MECDSIFRDACRPYILYNSFDFHVKKFASRNHNVLSFNAIDNLTGVDGDIYKYDGEPTKIISSCG